MIMKINNILTGFRKYLRKNGMRYTPEREIILRYILNTSEHFDADELFVELRHKRMDISRATVYRTLEILEKCGYVRKADFGEKHIHYEQVVDSVYHDHLICTSCGTVLEYAGDRVEEIYTEIRSVFGFEPVKRSFQIYGLCNECRKKEN